MLTRPEPVTVDNTVPHSRPWITPEDQEAVAGVLATGMLAKGRLSEQFERAVAERCSLLSARFLGSGRAALFKVLQALEIRANDEILIPTYVCHSVRDAVHAVGARAVLCDVRRDWCLDPADAARRLTKRTRAVVIVHSFGIAADVDATKNLGIPVIEDCAQAFGGQTTDGRKLGSIGCAAIYSLHPTKPLTAGTGGIAGSADPRLAAKLRSDLSVSFTEAANPVTDLEAALGLSQLTRYDAALERRQFIARRYLKELVAVNAELPSALADRSMYFRFPLRVAQPVDEIMAGFANRGVLARRGVDTLLHRAEGLDRTEFPGAESCFDSTVSIPIYPALTDAEISRVIAAARGVLGARP